MQKSELFGQPYFTADVFLLLELYLFLLRVVLHKKIKLETICIGGFMKSINLSMKCK